MPAKAPSSHIIKRIKETLRENPQGLWIRELARQSGIGRSTTHNYITKYMQNEIEDVLIGKGGFIRIVRLRK